MLYENYKVILLDNKSGLGLHLEVLLHLGSCKKLHFGDQTAAAKVLFDIESFLPAFLKLELVFSTVRSTTSCSFGRY